MPNQVYQDFYNILPHQGLLHIQALSSSSLSIVLAAMYSSSRSTKSDSYTCPISRSKMSRNISQPVTLLHSHAQGTAAQWCSAVTRSTLHRTEWHIWDEHCSISKGGRGICRAFSNGEAGGPSSGRPRSWMNHSTKPPIISYRRPSEHRPCRWCGGLLRLHC